MKTVDIHDATRNLSQLIDAVGKGEEVVIAYAGKPSARLVPMEAPTPVRKPGALKGRIRIAEDFDAPLPNQLQAAFEGK
jgi:prevent-host-death family protein